MRKVFSLFVVALFAVVMMAGGAWAGNGDLIVAATTDIPAEAAATMKADETIAGDSGDAGTTVVANDATTGVQYTLGTSYVNNDTITFTLSDGVWQEATYYLATIDNLDGTDANETLTPSPGGKTPFAQISKTDTVITFRVTDDTAEILVDDGGAGAGVGQSAVIAGVTYYLVQLNDPDTAVAGVLDIAGDDQTGNPTIDVSSLASAGTITLTVESNTSTGLALDTSGDKTETLVESFKQFTGAVDTLADGIIDVDEGRSQFTAVDPLVSTDLVVVNLISDADAEISTEQITTVAADSFTITISGDMGSLTSVGYDVNGDGDLDDVNDVAGVIDTTVSPNTAIIILAGDELMNAGGTIGDVAVAETEAAPLVFITDGTVLSTRSFEVHVSLALSGRVTEDLIASTTSLGQWTINGAQFVAPHMFQRDGWESYLVFKSEQASIAADIIIDVFNKAGETESVSFALPAGSSGGDFTVSASEILAAASTLTATGTDSDFSATITVTLPQEDVYVDGFRYTSGSTFPLNVYDNKAYGGAGGNQWVK